LAFEVLSAFFLEATFLGIMLFGFRRVSPTMHTVATFLVAIGTLLSAFWILVLNAWMQVPTGYQIINGTLYPSNWFGILFNPTVAYRFWHMLLASGLTAAFLVAGVSAYRWLRQDRSAAVLASLKTGVYLAAVLIPLQFGVGDLLGLNTLKHQPEKIAAIEGIWETGEGLPWHIFAWPDPENQRNHFEISIPYATSLLLTHRLDGKVEGLDAFKEAHPPVAPLFFGFRIMLLMGGLMLIVSWLGTWFL